MYLLHIPQREITMTTDKFERQPFKEESHMFVPFKSQPICFFY